MSRVSHDWLIVAAGTDLGYIMENEDLLELILALSFIPTGDNNMSALREQVLIHKTNRLRRELQEGKTTLVVALTNPDHEMRQAAQQIAEEQKETN